MIRVLVVDDSVAIRELIGDILEEAPDLTIVGKAKNGVEAVDLTRRLAPDVVTMDLNMPVLDGLGAIQQIMESCPTPIVVIALPSEEEGFTALRAGAVELVHKPIVENERSFRAMKENLVRTIRAMSEVRVVRRRSKAHRALPSAAPSGESFDMVAIGASLGGPGVLKEILITLPRSFPAPILIVQHINPAFVAGMARWLGQGCALRIKLAEDLERPEAGTVYIAPGEKHLRLSPRGNLALGNEAPVNGFRPSVDVLFESVAVAMGPRALGVLLTGMGKDGAKGLLEMRRAGARTLAQSEESCVVPGMPVEALRLGSVESILDPQEIAELLTRVASAGEPANQAG